MGVKLEVGSHQCSMSSMADVERRGEDKLEELGFSTYFEVGDRSTQVLGKELLQVRGLELGCLGSNIVSLIAGCDMTSAILHSPEATKTRKIHLQ